MAAARRWVPIATHYADPDDVDAAMRRLCDLEASDRTDGAPGDEVGCMRSGDGRRRVARVPHAFQARFTHFPAHPRAMRRQALVRVDRPQHDGRELTVCLVQHAQYLRVRPQLVDTVAQIAGLLGLSNDVVHLALAYLDRLHARTPRAGARLLAALACMVVAAKFSEVSQDDEGQGTLPSYHHVLAALGNPVGITTRHLVAWERRVLEVLEWRLSSATTSCFAHAYRAKGVFCADDTAGPERDGPPTPDEQARVCDHINFFCELATLQGITCAHGASVSAAAAVCAARVINDIHPSWPPSLARRLGKTYAHIDACTRTFLHLFRTQYADRAMDSDALLPAHAAALPSAPPQGPRGQGASYPEPRTTADCSGAGPGQEARQEAADARPGFAVNALVARAAHEPSSTLLQPSARDAREEAPGAPEASPPPAPPSFEPGPHASNAIAGPRSLEEPGSDLCRRSMEGPPRKAVCVWASSARERCGAGADAEAGSGGVKTGEYGGEEELGKRKRAGGGAER